MSRKSKIVVCSCMATLALLGAFSSQTLKPEPAFKALAIPSAYSLTCEDTISPYTRQTPTPEPHIRPMSAHTSNNRIAAPSELKATPVGDETANVGPDSTSPTEIDFEPQKPNATTEILTTNEPPRDNPTPEPSSTQTPSQQAYVEPQMGDTRIIDGQKQVYFLGFGWIEDNDEPNVGIVVDGDGDINKMVGTMD